MTVSSCIPRFDSLSLELSARRLYLNRIACLISFSHALVFLRISTILSSSIALLTPKSPAIFSTSKSLFNKHNLLLVLELILHIRLSCLAEGHDPGSQALLRGSLKTRSLILSQSCKPCSLKLVLR